MQTGVPSYVVFNGRAFQYKDAPLQVLSRATGSVFS